MTEKITRDVIEKLFKNMRKDKSIDVNGPLLWGYFFNDPSVDKLENAIKELEALGYEYVGVYSDEDETDFALHVQKVETHTVDSLIALNEVFYTFAAKHGIEAYDGMDVGRVENESEDEKA